MTSKQIVDIHFEKNYNYYRSVCYRYYKGRYLFEDLLNETYLRFLDVKDPVIFKFNDINKLHCIGLKIIKSLYQKRHNAAKNNKETGANSSPLFETPSLNYDFDFVSTLENKDELEIQIYFEKASNVIKKALQTPVNNERQNPYQLMQVFLAVQTQSLREISRDTKVNRKFITDSYKKSIEYLKKEIQK